MDNIQLITSLYQGLGIVAVTIALFEVVWRRISNVLWRKIATAVVLTIGMATSMLLPFELQPGVVFDLRHVFLMLAGPFGGLPAIAATVTTAAVLRVIEGGLGQTAGLIGIGITSLFSFAFMIYLKDKKLTLPILAAMGLTASIALISLVILPMKLVFAVLELIGPSLVITNLFSIMIVGSELNTRRHRVEKAKSHEKEIWKDPLTNLSNRRAFDIRGKKLTNKALKSKSSYGLLVIDIDNFKSVNDTFGHAIGDEVIRKIAANIKQQVPVSEMVARVGGEEFVVILTDTTIEHCRSVAERIRTAIQQDILDIRGFKLGVTVSIGFTLIRQPKTTLSGAFELADQALYRAKENGRNRTECIEDGDLHNGQEFLKRSIAS